LLLLEDDLVAFLQAFDDFGLRAVGEADDDCDFVRAFFLAFIGYLNEGILLRVVADGVLRDRQDAFVFVEHDFGVGGHVGLEFAGSVIDADADFEGGDVIFFHAEGRDLSDLAIEDAIAEALNLDARGPV
jgi:hypothetical protein